jgi:hypothetical protein
MHESGSCTRDCVVYETFSVFFADLVVCCVARQRVKGFPKPLLHLPAASCMAHCHVLQGTLILILEEPPESECTDAVARKSALRSPCSVVCTTRTAVREWCLPGWVYPGVCTQICTHMSRSSLCHVQP